jgi:hypothetical protein
MAKQFKTCGTQQVHKVLVGYAVKLTTGFLILCLSSVSCSANRSSAARQMHFDIRQIDREREISAADRMLDEEPITVTASHCPRSAGGKHDFFSEADYFWPDPAHPDGPYVEKDGLTNPENFVEHRRALIRFSIHVATLASAWRITGDPKYARATLKHFHAWFADQDTRMNPNLQFGQAVRGKQTGRNYGIIDTIHLIEVSRSASLLQQAGFLNGNDLTATRQWFTDYLHWLTTSEFGIQEMNVPNNHSTCWVMQVAAFASFTGDEQLLAMCRTRVKEVLIPDQLAADGSYPRELRRSKPYGYSLFNADAMTTAAWILSTPQDNLWEFTTPDGRNLKKSVEYIYPYIKNKSSWPLKPDAMFWEYWPVRSPELLFGGLAYKNPDWLATWSTLEANPTNNEVIRNLPIRHPVLWID